MIKSKFKIGVYLQDKTQIGTLWINKACEELFQKRDSILFLDSMPEFYDVKYRFFIFKPQHNDSYMEYWMSDIKLEEIGQLETLIQQLGEKYELIYQTASNNDDSKDGV